MALVLRFPTLVLRGLLAPASQTNLPIPPILPIKRTQPLNQNRAQRSLPRVMPFHVQDIRFKGLERRHKGTAILRLEDMDVVERCEGGGFDLSCFGSVRVEDGGVREGTTGEGGSEMRK